MNPKLRLTRPKGAEGKEAAGTEMEQGEPIGPHWRVGSTSNLGMGDGSEELTEPRRASKGQVVKPGSQAKEPGEPLKGMLSRRMT